MPEILAPVGGAEQLKAAVFSGADAVYLGTRAFNARRNAQNFDETELTEAVSFAHARGVKVYVTLNTLICDDEISLLISEIKNIAQSGADALILQDLAAVKYAKQICPDIELHASTQMAVHNTEGVKVLSEMGFSRVVLARELSLDEIAEIKKACPETELEVFVHGALCMSVSGCCYLSSIIGERSGNRGLCAQPCRLNFNVKGREYALSLKDMCHISYLKKLSSLGIESFKIEGRMKRPEYVAASVDACVKALKGEKYDEETLRNVFSRSGFTDGYISAKRNLSMFGYRTKDDVVAASPVLKKLKNLYKAEYPHVPVDMHFVLKQNQTSLTATCDKKEYTVIGENPQYNQEHKITEDSAVKNLTKTGGTPFYVRKISCDIDDNLMLSYSEINKMRREVLNKISLDKSSNVSYQINDVPPYIMGERNIRFPNKIYAHFQSEAQITSEESFSKIILPIAEIMKKPFLITKYPDKLVGYVPMLVFGEYEEKIRQDLVRTKELGLTEVLCDNIGFLHYCLNLGYTVHGGYALNITNSVALSEYAKLGICDSVVSFELSLNKISRLKSDIPIGIISYGHLPLMRFRSCPLRNEKGCSSCRGFGTITDRMGKVFDVNCNECPHMYSTMYNHLPLYIADKNIDCIDFTMMYFTKESKSQIEKITDLYIKKSPCDFERTNGLYFRNLK